MKTYTYSLKTEENKRYLIKNNRILPYYYEFLKKMSKNQKKIK